MRQWQGRRYIMPDGAFRSMTVSCRGVAEGEDGSLEEHFA